MDLVLEFGGGPLSVTLVSDMTLVGGGSVEAGVGGRLDGVKLHHFFPSPSLECPGPDGPEARDRELSPWYRSY